MQERETITLHFEDIEIEYVTRKGSSSGYFDTSFGNWLPDDDETAYTTVDYDLEVDKEDVINFIIEHLSEDDLEGEWTDEKARDKVVNNLDYYVDKFEELLLSEYRDEAVSEAESNYDPMDEIDWDSMPGGHDDYDFDECLHEAINLDNYEYAGYESGYDIYRKFTDGMDKAQWVAVYSGDGEEHLPFHITYEQALGKEPIKDSGIERVKRHLGRVMFPQESLEEDYEPVMEISEELLNELNDFLRSRNSRDLANIVRKDGRDCIYFDVYMGDWKHEHLRIFHLVNEFFKDRGYTIERDVEPYGETGEDTYSAEHFYEISYDDNMGPMYEGWLDDVKDAKNSRIKQSALDASSAMGNLVSLLGTDNKEQWEEQVTEEDIANMRNASNVAWLLYHYKNDGKVRPKKR